MPSRAASKTAFWQNEPKPIGETLAHVRQRVNDALKAEAAQPTCERPSEVSEVKPVERPITAPQEKGHRAAHDPDASQTAAS